MLLKFLLLSSFALISFLACLKAEEGKSIFEVEKLDGIDKDLVMERYARNADKKKKKKSSRRKLCKPKRRPKRKTTTQKTTTQETTTEEITTEEITTQETTNQETTNQETTTEEITTEETTTQKTTTPKPPIKIDCEELKRYYFSRYSSTIKINATKYELAERCKSCFKIKFGHKIWDHYQYLEDIKDKRTKKFVHSLNKMSKHYLNRITVRKYIERKLTSYINFPKFSIFEQYGNSYYYTYNSGLQNHAVLMRRKKIYEKGEVVFDVLKYDESGKTSLEEFELSEDNKIISLELSINGSDTRTIIFMTPEGKFLEDTLVNVKFSSMSFIKSKGFLYSAYAKDKENDNAGSNAKYSCHSLYYHKLGTSQEEDVLVADYRSDCDVSIAATVSDDGKHLFVYYLEGAGDDRVKIDYFRLSDSEITKKLKLKPLFSKFDANYDVVDSNHDEVIVYTTENAPTGKIIKSKISKAHRGESVWKVLIPPHPKKVIQNVAAIGKHHLLVHYLEDLEHNVYLFDKHKGELISKLDLDKGNVESFSGSIKHRRFFIEVSSQVLPQIVYKGNLDDLKKSEKKLTLEVVTKTEMNGIDKDDFVTKKIFYKSKNETRIPMFIFHKEGLELNGHNPVILTGYGGFGVSNLPSFSASSLLFAKHFNGIVAVACIRGGGEYGEKWHKDGNLFNKQNSFDDFIAGAEHLIEMNYTDPSKLSIVGGSNGGLLTAVVSQQRPDLFGSVITNVGVLDMLNFHKYTIGAAWMTEYGDPDKEKDFEYLLKYSPLHNLKMPKRPIQWPSTLLTTGLYDNRVPASHTLKYTAELYYTLQKGKKYQRNPILVQVKDAQGHSGGVTLDEKIKESVDILSFIKETLNIKWRY